jgi:hypothetical protein
MCCAGALPRRHVLLGSEAGALLELFLDERAKREPPPKTLLEPPQPRVRTPSSERPHEPERPSMLATCMHDSATCR